jgi:hypothetical protein
MRGTVRAGYTVAERLEQFAADVERRLKPSFDTAGVKYPPAELAFIAFKDSKVMEVYARDVMGTGAKDKKQAWHFIKAHPVLGASGTPGPKLMEGDRQVPEGVYRLELLNPNSRFHLSVRLSYPNDFDRRMAAAEGRTRLGGDIMIHGNSLSVGCLAIGDTAAEDVFVLSALVGKERVKVLISPTDFRSSGTAPEQIAGCAWVAELYETLREELRPFPKKT